MSLTALNSTLKITPGHLKKRAYLYIWQSALRQVFENTESKKTQRQYALRQQAIVLGWPAEAQVRFKGGTTKVLRLPMPARACQLRKTEAEIVAEIDRFLEQWGPGNSFLAGYRSGVRYCILQAGQHGSERSKCLFTRILRIGFYQSLATIHEGVCALCLSEPQVAQTKITDP
jgi:hypothetical protein